jgi:predicted nuclease of restriction endonuclease-like RecB superfamily
MLPADLLKARTSRGRIYPVYALLDPSIIDLAEKIIEAFDKNIGRKKKHLIETLKEYEDEGVDYRLIRGLSKLLERRCVFEVESPANPTEVRMKTFEEASKVGVVSLEDRERVIKHVGNILNLTPEDVEKTLYSDIEEELILRRFDSLQAETLIRYYNLALTQTLLFKCLRIEFTASDNWKRIFRSVKHLGLMYSVEKEEKDSYHHSYRIAVDGPMSLFKMTDRYGTLLAKILPEIVASESWSIKSEILGRDRNRIYIFELRSNEVKDIISDIQREEAYAPRLYDSTVEEKFAKRFDALNSGWIVKREPEPLPAGRHVLIPDFGFEKHGVKVYLEVVGFWTQEYLERKISKLSSLVNIDMIVAVDQNLACSKLRKMRGPVIYYTKDVPVKPILDHLHMREEEISEGEAELLKSRELNLKGDIVGVEDIAKEQAVTVDAARQFVENLNPEGYRRVGDYFISEDKIKELADKISSLGETTTFYEAANIIEAEGLNNPQQILETLGYTVEWFGLTPEMSKVRRK